MSEVRFGDPRLPERFWSQVMTEPNSGCWLWTGTCDGREYGKIYYRSKTHRAHRLSYWLLVAPFDPGLSVDHLCRTHCCVNPSHLEPVTQRVNLARGIGPRVTSARHAAVTHCPQGHEYAGTNLYQDMIQGKYPHRTCRTCSRARTRAWRQRLKEAA